MKKVAAALNLSEEKLKAAMGGSFAGRPDLATLASKLGVKVETLQKAMQQASPADAPPMDGGNGNRKDPNRPDFNKVAVALGVTREQLDTAIGDPNQGRPDLATLAGKLGVTVEALQKAVQQASPAGAPPPGMTPPGGGNGGGDEPSQPDLAKAAAALNVTEAQLKSAMGDPSQGRPDLSAVATNLGVSVAALQAAMQLAIPEQKNTLPGNTLEDELSSERHRLMQPDKIVELVNPQKGGTFLDLGAGYGLFSFRLARAVGPEGKIFATDVDTQVIKHLADRAVKEEIKNVFPVKVSGHGLDAFYREHEFDVIFASDCLAEIGGPEAFFDQLQSSLKKDTGRLWIIIMSSDPDFSLLEFGDAAALQTALKPGPAVSCILQRLSPATRQLLEKPADPNTSAALAAGVMQDLNKMLEDPTLWPAARDSKVVFSPREANLRDSLVQLLEERKIFSQNPPDIGDARHLLRLLNRVIIADLLGSKTWGKAIALNKLTKSQLKPLLAPLTFDDIGHPKFLDEVGYELVKDHKDLNYCAIWAFKRVR